MPWLLTPLVHGYYSYRFPPMAFTNYYNISPVNKALSMARWLWLLLLTTQPPHLSSPLPTYTRTRLSPSSDLVVELPLTRLRVPLSGRTQLELPPGGSAELRLGRLYCQCPIRICVERDGLVECDVEKMGWEGGGEVTVTVWAEREGIWRPGRTFHDEPIYITVVFEQRFLGIPYTAIPIISWIATIITAIPSLILPFYMRILEV